MLTSNSTRRLVAIAVGRPATILLDVNLPPTAVGWIGSVGVVCALGEGHDLRWTLNYYDSDGDAAKIGYKYTTM